jgi:hypothetical protein
VAIAQTGRAFVLWTHNFNRGRLYAAVRDPATGAWAIEAALPAHSFDASVFDERGDALLVRGGAAVAVLAYTPPA